LDTLLEFRHKLTREELANLLSRTKVAVKMRLKGLPRKFPIWTKSEYELINEKESALTAKEIAKLIGRTEVAVYSRLQRSPLREAWERLHGKVPMNMHVGVIDGDVNNLSPDNLTLHVNHRQVALKMTISINGRQRELEKAYLQNPKLIEAQAALYEAERVMKSANKKQPLKD